VAQQQPSQFFHFILACHLTYQIMALFFS
jgi:hypothetical protein